MDVQSQLNEAHSFYKTGEFKRACAKFREVTEADPSNPNAWNGLSVSLRQSNLNEEAEIAARQAVKIDQTIPGSWNNLGFALFRLGKNYDAAKAFGYAAVIDSTDPKYWTNTGQAYYQLGNHSAAVDAYRRAIAIDSVNILAWEGLGDVFKITQDFCAAEQAYSRSLGLGYQKSEIWNTLGTVLENQDNLPAALNIYQRAIELDPNNAVAHYNLGDIFRKLENYPKAEASYRTAIQLKPDESDYWINLGVAYSIQGNYAAAETAHRTAIKLDEGNQRAWYNLGIALRGQENMIAAERAYLKATELNSEDASSWNNLGNLMSDQEKYDLAEQYHRNSLLIQPNNPRYLYNLGRALEGQEKFLDQEETVRMVMELDPMYPDVWYALGTALASQERHEEAEAAYRRATKINPKHSWSWYNLGISLRRQEKYDHSEKCYKKSIALDRANPDVWHNLSSLMMVQQRYEEAETAAKCCTELSPYDSDSWLQLGVALRSQGKHVEAERVVRKAIKVNSDPQYMAAAYYIHALLSTSLQRDPGRIISLYRKMSGCIEYLRQNQTNWEKRLSEYRNPVSALCNAASFSLAAGNSYTTDSLKFSAQAKARSMAELLEHNNQQLISLISSQRREKFDLLRREVQSLEMERHGLIGAGLGPHIMANKASKRIRPFTSPEEELWWQQRRQRVWQDQETFFKELVADQPDLKPFILGPKAQPLRFSSKQLMKGLAVGEALIDLLLTNSMPLTGIALEDTSLIAFVINKQGISRTSRRIMSDPMHLGNDPTLEEWRNEVISILHIGEGQRAEYIKRDLTPETLTRWGELLYGPFIDDLKGIKRLWISPHSFLTQLPFNAIPFPDGIEREVAIIPSAASLTRPSPKGPRPKPRFTLGVVAADAVEQAPLNLQSEEVRHLRSTVKSAKHRWELAGNRVGEEPTLANIQDRAGLTRCLVLSCHGDGPNQDWGTLFLGSKGNSEPVTGRQLVDSLLLGGRLRNMEVDLVITSACLTGQVDLERAEEWLGLPMALQSVWKTKAMLLTLWEVEELPAMIWVVELVKALTQGLSAGQAQKIAQDKVKNVTKREIEAIWLAEAQQRLPEDRWRKVDNQWRDTSRSTDQRPFSAPVHWAPFIMVGDPKITVSPLRSTP